MGFFTLSLSVWSLEIIKDVDSVYESLYCKKCALKHKMIKERAIIQESNHSLNKYLWRDDHVPS